MRKAPTNARAKAVSAKVIRRLLYIWFGGTFLIGYGIGLYSFWHLIP